MQPNDVFEPHLLEGELPLFQREVSRAQSYLEFGMGGSTLFAATLGRKRIVSIDSDSSWVSTVADSIAPFRKISKIDLIHCDIGPTGAWGAPVNHDMMANWPQYFQEPWRRFAAECAVPDLVYVDGRFRVACTLYSILRLYLAYMSSRASERAITRIMIHDFTNRPQYHKVIDYAQIVEQYNTLAVLELREHLSLTNLVSDLLEFQFVTP